MSNTPGDSAAVVTPAKALKFAENVRVLAARHKLSQAKIAGPLGISQVAVSRRLSGEVAFTVNELFILANVFGCDVRDILPLDDDEDVPAPDDEGPLMP